MGRRTLLLLRHAEAAPPIPGCSDHGRELTARGRAEAEEVGRELAARRLLPDLAIASDAKRAVDTMLLALRNLTPAPRELVVPDLYIAEEQDLLNWTRRSGGSAATLLVVGHNPAIETFANQMASRGEPVAASRIGSGYPPAALAVFDIHAPTWSDFDPSHAEVRLFLLPDRD